LSEADDWLTLCIRRSKNRDKLKRKVNDSCKWIDTGENICKFFTFPPFRVSNFFLLFPLPIINRIREWFLSAICDPIAEGAVIHDLLPTNCGLNDHSSGDYRKRKKDHEVARRVNHQQRKTVGKVARKAVSIVRY
jgi:hypothetical protein